MKTKHTSGPWKLTDMRQDPRTDGIAINCENVIAVFDAEWNQVAKVNPEFEPNARLISLAPELLEALIEVQATCKLSSSALHDRIKSLISRSRGAE